VVFVRADWTRSCFSMPAGETTTQRKVCAALLAAGLLVIIASVLRLIRVAAFQTLEHRFREVTARYNNRNALQFASEVACQSLERWINGNMNTKGTTQVRRTAPKQGAHPSNRGEEIDHPGLPQ
jgi:uncharacterized membrane protein YcjF (UPF0283 family)